MVELIRRHGICEEADIAEVQNSWEEEVLVVKMPAPGEPPVKYDLAFLDLSGSATDPAAAVRAVEAAVADDGALVVISAGGEPLPGEDERLRRLLEYLPAGWRGSTGASRGFKGSITPAEFADIERSLLKEYTLEAQCGFGTAASETVRDRLARQRPSGMERAVACLLLYAETLLVDYDILTPSIRVKTYRKGRPRYKHAEPQERWDIVRVQDLEIDRLKRAAAFELGYQVGLIKDLAVEVENLERAAKEFQRLTEEQEFLKKRGPRRYWSILMSRVDNKGVRR